MRILDGSITSLLFSSACVLYACTIQLLNVGVGCPKYDDALKKAYESDWVKALELKNKVGDIKFLLR